MDVGDGSGGGLSKRGMQQNGQTRAAINGWTRGQRRARFVVRQGRPMTTWKHGTKTQARQGRETRGAGGWLHRRSGDAYVIIIQNAVESACGPWGAAVRPNASACVSKH